MDRKNEVQGRSFCRPPTSVLYEISAGKKAFSNFLAQRTAEKEIKIKMRKRSWK